MCVHFIQTYLQFDGHGGVEDERLAPQPADERTVEPSRSPHPPSASQKQHQPKATMTISGMHDTH